MPISGNKGEWSEIYVLFKLLGDGIIYAGDAQMIKIPDVFYPILSVIRQEEKHLYKYNPNTTEERIVSIVQDEEEVLRIPMSKFSEFAEKLLTELKDKKKTRAFSLPEIETYMNDTYCHTLKAKSVDKADIRIVIHDLRTGMTPRLGFSIKSQLGQPSTLLNAGTTTHFIFRIDGSVITEEFIDSVNSIESQNERMKAIFDNGGELVYDSMECQTFEDNLVVIDTCLPRILGELLIECYKTGHTRLLDIVNDMSARNVFNVRKPNIYYKAKIVSLLVDAALGMTPAKPWERKYDANGGYLVVRKDGEILCYHFYDRNQLEDYLLTNTRLEFASRERYEYGNIYWGKDLKVYIKLNLQIRFIQ